MRILEYNPCGQTSDYDEVKILMKRHEMKTIYEALKFMASKSACFDDVSRCVLTVRHLKDSLAKLNVKP